MQIETVKMLVAMQVVGQETDAVVPGCPSHGDRLLPGIVMEGVSRLRGEDSGDPPRSRAPSLPRSGLTKLKRRLLSSFSS